MYAERRTFILFPSGERSFSFPILPSSPGVPSLPSSPIHFRGTERETTHEISYLRRARISRSIPLSTLPPLASSPLRPLPLASLFVLYPSLFASYQPLALLLLSDYCAAVTAVCRSACIRVIHFLGNISSCAPHEFRLTRARKTARSVPAPPHSPSRLSLFLSDPSSRSRPSSSGAN